MSKNIHKKPARGHTNYSDMNGQMRTFTHIDYSNVGNSVHFTDSDLKYGSFGTYEEFNKAYKEHLLNCISLYPSAWAILDDSSYDGFIKRGDSSIVWNDEVLKSSESLSLLFLLTILRNTAGLKNSIFKEPDFIY